MFTNYLNMRLLISPTSIISDIQKEFNNAFPFLKLEFFNNKTFTRTNFTASQIIHNNKKLGDGQLGIIDTILEINEEMKVSEFENIFRDKFRLAVQVFRKSGNLWLETTMTDDWTLQQQNNHGREISTIKKKIEKPGDYDLTRVADN